MRKSFKAYLAIWFVLLITFNVLFFLAHSQANDIYDNNGLLIVSYISVIIGFVVQLISSIFAFKETINQKFFYKFPLITISFANLLGHIVIGLLVTYCINISYLAVVVPIVILNSISIISLVETKLNAKLIINQDLSINKNVLLNKIEGIYRKDKANIYIKDIYELIKYSNAKVYDNPNKHQKINVLIESLGIDEDRDCKKVLEELREVIK